MSMDIRARQSAWFISVHEVLTRMIKYFLSMADSEEGSDISNLKLQKLLYYAQAFHLAIFENPLFDEEINAWAHGSRLPFGIPRIQTVRRQPHTIRIGLEP